MRFSIHNLNGGFNLAFCIRMMMMLLTYLLPAFTIYAQEKATSVFKTSDYTIQQDTTNIDVLIARSDKVSQRNIDSAIVLLKQAYELSQTYNLPYKKAKILGSIGRYYLRKGDTRNSILYLEAAYKEAESVKDGGTLATLHNTAAVLYQQQGEYANSVINYSKGLDMLRRYKLDTALQAAQIYNNLAGLCLLMKEETQALNYLLEAKKILRKEDHTHIRTLAYVLTNIGLSYATSDKAIALQYLFEALPIAQAQKDIYLANKLLINISGVYVDEQNFPLAIKYMQEALITGKTLGTQPAMALSNYQAGHVYLKMKNYPKAIHYLSSSLSLSQQTGYKDVVLDLQTELGDAFAAMGDYKQAFAYKQAFISLKDSLQHAEKNKTLAILLKYQAAEKNKEIIQAQFKLTQKETALKEKNIWIGVILVGIGLSIVLLVIILINNKHKQNLQLVRSRNYAQEQEIEHLKYAVEGEENERTRISRELHDGVMVRFALVKMGINSLTDIAPSIRDEAAYKLILKQFDQATTELRRTAHNLMPDVLLEEGIAQAIYYFCKNVEETTNLTILFHKYGILPSLSASFEISLYRIVQELLQNIIKHAQATRTIVQLNYGNNLLSVTVEDNGKGIYPDEHDGMGLKSIRNRVRIMKGSFEINSNKESGTAVYLEFDLHSSPSLMSI